MTLRKMSVAMNREQMGSAINQPNCRMSTVEMMTPTLPSVSANTCRKTPGQERDSGVKEWRMYQRRVRNPGILH